MQPAVDSVNGREVYERKEYGGGASPITMERVASVRAQVLGTESSMDPR